MATTTHILSVEDDQIAQEVLIGWLTSIPEIAPVIDTCSGIDSAIQKLTDKHFDVVLLDLGIEGSSGLQTFQRIKSICPDSTAIIILTGTDITENVWKEIGANGYIKKTALTQEKVSNELKAFLRLRSLRSTVRQAESLLYKISAQVNNNGRITF